MNVHQQLAEIKGLAQQILADVPKAGNGNKAAAKRIRKATLELGNRVGKEFRKDSVRDIG